MIPQESPSFTKQRQRRKRIHRPCKSFRSVWRLLLSRSLGSMAHCVRNWAQLRPLSAEERTKSDILLKRLTRCVKARVRWCALMLRFTAFVWTRYSSVCTWEGNMMADITILMVSLNRRSIMETLIVTRDVVVIFLLPAGMTISMML